MDNTLKRCFREQSQPQTCVAACLRMLAARHGQDRDELAFANIWALELAAPEHGFYLQLDFTETRNYQFLTGELEAGNWLVVTMATSFMDDHLRRRTPPPSSRHGRLAPTRPPRIRFHAIVLTRATSKGFEYLDPWYPAEYQPFALTTEDFAEGWSGEVLVSEKAP